MSKWIPIQFRAFFKSPRIFVAPSREGGDRAANCATTGSVRGLPATAIKEFSARFSGFADAVRIKGCFLLAAILTTPAFGQTRIGPDAPAPLTVPTTAPVAKLFRSRLAGIELLPPAGGRMIRQLDTGEIVRFVYADRSWDVRVKPVPLHIALSLDGLLDLTAKQLVDSNPSTEIVSKTSPRKDLGIIEARYNAGADRLFAQQALFREDDQSYFLVQMGSPTGKAKNAPADPADPQETVARAAFANMTGTVKLLDRRLLTLEQEMRQKNTRALWLLLDQKRVLKSLIPVHFMRIVRDGKDVGFVQINEREAAHGSRPGVEVIVRSRVTRVPDETLAVKPDAAPAVPGSTGVVVPTVTQQPTAAATSQPSDMFTFSNFYFSFDREPGFATSHEDWETLTQADQNKAGQVRERGNADLSVRLSLDRTKLSLSLRQPTTTDTAVDHREPPVKRQDKFVLSVSQDVKNRRAATLSKKLVWFYIPQGLRQLLPRLLPLDEPGQYMFAAYSSEQREVMARYVDVGLPTDTVLDGVTVHAIPVTDRVGIDGNPTIHYMTVRGEWLGSVSDEGRFLVLPAAEKDLQAYWPGFVKSEEPPLPVDSGAVLQPEGVEGR